MKGIKENNMRKLPKKLKISGINYRVKQKKHPRLSKEGEAYYGTESAGKCVINIEKSHPSQRQMDTLLHEIIHVISYGLKINLDEGEVTRLGTGLFQVLRDNKLKFY